MIGTKEAGPRITVIAIGQQCWWKRQWKVRVFVTGNTRNNSRVVSNKFLSNGRFASVQLDSDADKSFMPKRFSH
jgi:hypothetical protein